MKCSPRFFTIGLVATWYSSNIGVLLFVVIKIAYHKPITSYLWFSRFFVEVFGLKKMMKIDECFRFMMMEKKVKIGILYVPRFTKGIFVLP
jgi:hypothetical protein